MEIKEKLKVAGIQLSSGSSFHENVRSVTVMLEKTAKKRPDLAILPENLFSHGNFCKIKKNAMELKSWMDLLSSIRSKVKINSFIVWGGLPILKDGKIFNSSIVTAPTGSIVTVYEKNRLFSFSGEKSVTESDIYSIGKKGASFNVYGWRIALSICFDLRYPELFRRYKTPDLIVCTAAFTRKTGQSHWGTLLKARAIENQAYVIGVNQWTESQPDYPPTYGHTMIIDSWGKVLSLKKSGKGIISQIMTKEDLEKTRNMIKM